MILRVLARIALVLFAVGLIGTAVLSGWLAVTAYAAYREFGAALDQSDLTNGRMPLSSKIFDRNGKLLDEVYTDARRTYVPLDQISPNLQHAAIATEDSDFYTNFGISPRGIARAVWANIRNQD